MTGKKISALFKYGGLPIITALVIFYLCCLIPNDEIPEVEMEFFIPFDKLVHFIMYFGLSVSAALYYIYDKKGHINKVPFIIGVIIVPILYGGFIEIVQSLYFPPRSGDWFDFLADSLGVLFALPFICYYRKKIMLLRSVGV